MSNTPAPATSPVLCVMLRLADEVVSSASTEALCTSVKFRLDALLAALGIPGTTEVVQVSLLPASPGWLSVEVGEHACPYPEDLLQEAYAYVTGALSVTSLRADEVQQLSPEKLQLFLALAVEAILKLKPSQLLSATATEAYRTALLQHTKKALPKTPDLEAILSGVLNLGLSLAAHDVVAATLAETFAETKERVDLTETVIARLRPRLIEIRLPTTYWQQLMILLASTERTLFHDLREGLWYELGSELPDLQFVPDDTLLPESFAFRFNHLTTLPRKGLSVGQWLVNDTPDRLRLFNVEGAMAVNPANQTVCTVVDTSVREDLKDDYPMWSALGYLVLALSDAWRTHAASCLDFEVVETQLGALRASCDRLVTDVQQRYTRSVVTQTFRRLLSEGISLRNMRRILQSLIDCDYVITDETALIVFDPRLTPPLTPPADWLQQPRTLAAAVRLNLKHYLGQKYARGQSSLIVYLLEPQIEKLLATSFVSASPDVRWEDETRIRAAVAAELQTLPPGAVIPAILTTTGVRAVLRDLLATSFPRLPVLAYQELAPDMNIQPIARITLAES